MTSDVGPRLVCCGLTTLDVVQVVERVPGPDEKVTALAGHVAFGGPAANAAATAVALGVPATLVTALGAGPVAAAARAGLVARGVDVVDLLDGAARAAAWQVPVSTVLVTAGTGERAVASANGTGLPVDLLGRAAASALPAALAGATCVLVDGHHLGAAVPVARAARERGVPVLLDGGSWKPGLDRLLRLVDHAVLSAVFTVPAGAAGERPLGAGTGAAAVDALLDVVAGLGPMTVARSAGAGPVRVRRTGPTGVVREDVQPPSVPADEVVDTLGAGDVLHGAVGAALAGGAGPVEALRSAVLTAARSVRHPGALGWADAPG